MSTSQAVGDFKQLRQQGKTVEGLSNLQQALRRGAIDADGLDQVGRLLLRHGDAWPRTSSPLKILILGQCTTSWFVPALTAVAFGRGQLISVREGGYDNIIQDLSSMQLPADVVVLVPWNQRFLSPGDRTWQQRIDDELTFLRQAWDLVQRGGSRLVQVGYDYLHAGAAGHHLAARGGSVEAIRTLNEQIRRHAIKGSYFVDLEQVSGGPGRETFYDARSYHWTKQPFSRMGVARLCGHLWAGIRAVTTGPKKVLVLDLDNTLWGGVVGETGAQGVALGETPEGEAFVAFQRQLFDLSARGVVLAVCSKNNPQDAREVFENNDRMVLKLAQIACFEASWDAKPAAIERIAKTLRLGLDSFVFFDDNPAEREFVLQALPDVEVVNVPEDPAGYVGALYEGLWFESAGMTEADQSRALQYQEEAQRRQAEQAAGSVEDYLASLEMVADVRRLDENDMDRAVQLLGKTNQFNLTTRRHPVETVRRIAAEPDSIAITLRMADRFGDAGLVSLVLGVPEKGSAPRTLRLDTWLMSCRVIARTVEDFTLNQIAGLAVKAGYQRLRGEFIATAKNQLVADFYDRMGFTRCPNQSDNVVSYDLDLNQFTPRSTSIRGKTASEFCSNG